MHRWLQYQKERFPFLQHGPLVAVFSFCAVSFSGSLRGAPMSWTGWFVAFPVCLFSFLHLRIADEHKDAEIDRRWRPGLPVPRGLVTLRELRLWWIATGILQFVLLAAYDLRLLLFLFITWLYLALMTAEFFVRSWLVERPIAYLLSHMLILPLVDLMGTACDWMPAAGHQRWEGLVAFLATSFGVGVVIEFGRKIRAPEDEEPGVRTYSSLWSPSVAALAWLGVLVGASGLAVLAAIEVGVVGWMASLVGCLILGAALVTRSYLRSPTRQHAARFETYAGIFTLCLYAGLGGLPRLVSVL